MSQLDHYENESDGLAVTPRNPMYAMPGMPVRGWVQTDEIDLGSPSQRCGWCDARIIRYVCRVEHPDGHHAEVGRVCCSSMTGDSGEDLHLEFKERRASFTRRWKQSKSTQGNYRRVYVAPDGRTLYLTCYKRFGSWMVCIKDRDNPSDVSFWTKQYATLLNAKEALFFYFEHQRRHELFRRGMIAAADAPAVSKHGTNDAPAQNTDAGNDDACSGLGFHQRSSLLFGFDVKDWKRQPESVKDDVRAFAAACRNVLACRGIDEADVAGLPDVRWDEIVGEARAALRSANNHVASWRDHPATRRQIEKLKGFGEANIKWAELTKGDASDLIAEHVARA